jgi:acyl carrier protein
MTHDVDITPSVRDFVTRRFRAALGGRAVADDTPLFSTGIIDSFGVLELIAHLESRFDIEIDPARHDLSEFDTVAKIATLVRQLRGGHAPQ